MRNPVIAQLGRRLRLGLVGGGSAAMIGPVHRRAARLDDLFEITAAVLSSDPGRAQAQAAELGIPRGYADLEAMLAAECRHPERIDALAIATPNDSHFAIARAVLEAGFHVICDKPLTNELATARELASLAQARGLLCCVTHNYSGYPMVRQARAMVAEGALGRVHLVQVTYLQGSLGIRIEADPARIAPRMRWRITPERGGASHVMGDIGSHAHQLATFVAGQEVTRVMADVGTVMPPRDFDDTGMALLEFAGGAKGVFLATKAATGSVNGLVLEIYGDGGGLSWSQTAPNELVFRRYSDPAQILARGGPGLHPLARRATRVPAGHPEGFHEAFANLYADFAEHVAARLAGRDPDPLACHVPTAIDGARSLAFIEATLRSTAEGRWVEVPSLP